MDRKTGTLLAAAVLVTAMVVWSLSSPTGAVLADTGEMDSHIQVIGEAEVTATPDQARITLGVETSARTADQAVSDNASLTERAVRSLKDYGLSDDQITTGSYRIHSYREPVNGPRPEGNEQVTGYRVVNEMVVVLDDPDQVGDVIDLAVEAGVNQVHSLRFEVSDPDRLKIKALEQATRQAREKGEAIAGAAGTTITGIKSISEDSLSYSPFRMMADTAEMGAGGMGTPILPDDVKVSARVVVKYYMR